MRILVIGGTGLLGRALISEAITRKYTAISAARSGGDYRLDIRDDASLMALLDETQPDVVINAAALVDLAACEADPALAQKINTEPLNVLAAWSRANDKPLVHISTDHFFDGDGNAKHDEAAKVMLVNAYARSKHAAEAMALKAPKALVLRTCIAGFHPDGRGFAHWAMDGLENYKPMTLFDDFYGSTLDVQNFSAALFDLLKRQSSGLFNLASSEVSSKAEFIMALAKAAGIKPDRVEYGSVTTLKPRRARSLGLGVGKAEQVLGYVLPDREAVAAALASQWRQRS